jgi:hypothetical protein
MGALGLTIRHHITDFTKNEEHSALSVFWKRHANPIGESGRLKQRAFRSKRGRPFFIPAQAAIPALRGHDMGPAPVDCASL